MTFDNSLGIWLLRADAETLALALQKALGGEIYRPWLSAGDTNREQFAAAYRGHRQWLILGAPGIAVRFLDGLIHDKHTDPAVVVLDEAGRFAVSLLAGHEGGANALAYRVANAVGAVPVIGTATEALKSLTVGIGCRKGVEPQRIAAAVMAALDACGRALDEVRELATVDLKAHEAGLLAYSEAQAIPLRVFARATLAARQWVTQPSEWVKQNVGLDGVCEPCALLAAPRGTLLVPKMAVDGVAVAVVEDKWMVL
jgi:cobalt-precorrin 5A hydrolase